MSKRVKILVAVAALASAVALSACSTPSSNASTASGEPDRILEPQHGGCPQGYHTGPNHHYCYADHRS